jgi:transposase
MPNVNRENMQIFLEEFAKTLDEEVILVMDNASWHTRLMIPDNIHILYLPPYSPELNPIERLWGYIKDQVLKNRIFDTLTELEQAVCTFLNCLTADTIASVCRCSYIL